jgi:GT2 family glycosyltransferase
MSLTVAVCITTRNRCAELARTLAVLARLAPAPDEVLIAADGCTDGTLAMLRAEHPHLRVFAHEQPHGSIPSRNELAAACQSDIFVSLDDDSYPLEVDFIARVRALFAQESQLAVVTFPQRTDERPETLTATDFGPACFVGSYANSGAAIRRSVFLLLDGYPDFFFHAYEEPDFALRCAAAGWQVRHEPSLTIRHHFTTTERNERRTHQRHARNELWSVLLRCPAPQLIAVALFRIVRQFGYAWRRGWDWAVREPSWWLAALGGIPRCLAERQPLPWPRYRAWMELVRSPIISETEWSAKFGHDAP